MTKRSMVLAAAAAVAVLSAGCAAVPKGPAGGVTGPVPAPAAPPPSGIAVDPSKVPSASAGTGAIEIAGQGGGRPALSDAVVGAFRTICEPSHMAADDPIVVPGQPGGSHLHTFFGNAAVNAFTTTESLTTTGNSTCNGGIANRSGYWTPSIIDTATGAAIMPDDIMVYYKSGYSGVLPSSIQAPPTGLRMVAGNAKATGPTGAQPYQRAANWSCNAATDSTLHAGIPRGCGPGSTLTAVIRFPQCWDGVNLDSPDHISHMAFGVWGEVFGRNGAGCPASHPVALPEITFNIHYIVPAGGVGSWRLSSDMYSGGDGGYSLHADWWNGWDPAIMSVWINNCVRGFDCSTDFLGDGRKLV